MKNQNTPSSTNTQWYTFPTPEEVAIAARNEILQMAQAAIQDHNEFRIVLAGGSSSEQVYALLAKEPINWSNWQLYLGDERCKPIGHSERNSQMIQRALLEHISIPEKNIHFIPAEHGGEVAAKLYAEEVKSALPFDLVMLGMGEDGHTASLFPNHIHNSREYVHAVSNSPKPPSDRVSLSFNSINNSQLCLIITMGTGKKEAIKRWKGGEDLPITRVSSTNTTKIFTDNAAMP